MRLTEEQAEIISCKSKEIYVNAKAGTGKTSTLLQFVKSRPAELFLYLVYNKKNKEEAERKFNQGNVKVETMHSLAYKYVGKDYKDKLSNNINIFNVISNIDVLNNIYQKDKTNMEVFVEAAKVIECLELFFNKNFQQIEETAGLFSKKTIAFANELFEKMIDPSNEKALITHNGYLKLFQLSYPKLNYDYILVDEAQDSNQIMVDIVKQSPAKKIFVGDEYQAIYGFRHNINIFTSNKDDEAQELFLTKSFRFGETIAFYANVLNQTFRENCIPIQGNENIQDLVLDAPDKTLTNSQYTILTRTNAHLFDLAARYAQLGKTIYIVGSKEVFQELLDAMHLFLGELHKIKNPNLLEFSNFNKLKEIQQTSSDPELRFLVKVVEKYGASISDVISRIEQQRTKEIYADVILCTAHKSKGLEWDNVVLATDFPELLTEEQAIKSTDEVGIEEINLLYVAMTRAIKRLYLNESIATFFNKVL